MATNNNPNANAGLTNRQKWSLEGKAKQGWKCYFIERDTRWEMTTVFHNAQPLAQEIRAGGTPDITHLTQMFMDLYDKVGEIMTCPVCMEDLVKDNTHLPICGHLICKDCKSNPLCVRCPICRKDY
jgi:hypothetical protein